MGQTLTSLRTHLTQPQPESCSVLTFFQQNEQLSYPKNHCKKCLQKMVDIVDLGQSNSLKKMYKYLNPALKYIVYCKEENKVMVAEEADGDRDGGRSRDREGDVSIGDNYVRIYQEELINSAGTVLQMYCQLLRKVVPANMSYFHFMRENDLYIHYSTLKYVLEAGNAGTLFRTSTKSPNVFNRLKTQSRLLYIKLLSHWLYDMIKYKCSAISLQSSTLPQLILITGSLLCNLLSNQKINYLQQFQIRHKNKTQKLQIYQHCLYCFGYMLTEAHMDRRGRSQQGNGCLQAVLLGICGLLGGMWGDTNHADGHGEHPQNDTDTEDMKAKVMYAPSYWFAESIGFVKEPFLENLVFLVILDMIRRTQKQQNQYPSTNPQPEGQPNQPPYQIFQDENEHNASEEKQEQKFSRPSPSHHPSDQLPQQNMLYNNSQILQANTQNIMNQIDGEGIGGGRARKVGEYFRLNLLTRLMLYRSVLAILDCFRGGVDVNVLQIVIWGEIQNMPPNSLIRPYILQILTKLSHLSQQPHQQVPKNPITLFPKLQEYLKRPHQNYSTQNHIISQELVGINLTLMINSITSKILLSYYEQVDMDQGQIWREVLRWNVGKMGYVGGGRDGKQAK